MSREPLVSHMFKAPFQKKSYVDILYTVGYNKRSQQTPYSYLMFSTGQERLIFFKKIPYVFGLITYLPYCTLNFSTVVCTRRDIARIFIFLEISSSHLSKYRRRFFVRKWDLIILAPFLLLLLLLCLLLYSSYCRSCFRFFLSPSSCSVEKATGDKSITGIRCWRWSPWRNKISFFCVKKTARNICVFIFSKKSMSRHEGGDQD